jgi:hypothetical protein
VRATRIIGGLSVLVLSGAIAWDLANDEFWSRHALVTSLVASLIVVAVTAAVLNEVLERRQRERWSVLAQYALFEFVRTARLVWTGLLELAGLAPAGELGDEALAAGSDAVRDTPLLAAAMDEMLASADRREQLHRLIVGLLGHGQEVLGRWAGVMVNSDTYAEIVDRHVESSVLVGQRARRVRAVGGAPESAEVEPCQPGDSGRGGGRGRVAT